MAVDYRSLIADRRAKQTRPIVRHEICLVPELNADLEQALDAVDEWTRHDQREDIYHDTRSGGSGSAELIAAKKELADIEDKVAEVSITAVFKAPTADRQAQISDALQKAREDEPDRLNALVVESTRSLIVECFDHAEGPGRERLDLTADDISSVIGEWAQGEIVTLGNRIQNASVGALDLPKSVTQSLRNRPSVATSKRRLS